MDVAAIRPDSWNLPLFLHVLGAMALVGGLLAASALLAFAGGSAPLIRLGHRALLLVALPGWVLMFAAGTWSYHREGFAEGSIDATWILVGFLVAEVGLVALLAALVLGGLAIRRLDRGGGQFLVRSTLALSLALLAANVVAAWAMAAKPD